MAEPLRPLKPSNSLHSLTGHTSQCYIQITPWLFVMQLSGKEWWVPTTDLTFPATVVRGKKQSENHTMLYPSSLQEPCVGTSALLLLLMPLLFWGSSPTDKNICRVSKREDYLHQGLSNQYRNVTCLVGEHSSRGRDYFVWQRNSLFWKFRKK